MEHDDTLRLIADVFEMLDEVVLADEDGNVVAVYGEFVNAVARYLNIGDSFDTAVLHAFHEINDEVEPGVLEASEEGYNDGFAAGYDEGFDDGQAYALREKPILEHSPEPVMGWPLADDQDFFHSDE